MDIGLDISVVEHMTSDARVLGSIPRPAIYYHLYLFVYVHSSHPFYTVKFQDPPLTGIGFHLVPQLICYWKQIDIV